MDLDALAGCLSSSACLVTQTTSGLIIGMLLFLVAVGLTLIFGVLKVVNFSHGAFYMFGAYFAMTAYHLTDSFALAMLAGAGGTAILGLIFERVFMSRVYGADVLMQLLVCYAFVLIFDDVVRIIWGPEFKSMGMPAAFQVMPLFIAGGVVPPYYLLLIGVALVAAIVLGIGLSRSRIGKVIRAAAHNPGMVSALGINTGLIYGGVFALGGMLAGLAGALAAPVRSLTPRHGIFGADRILHRHRDRRHGLDPGRPDRRAADRPDPLVRLARLSPVHGRSDVPVHGDRAGLQAHRPVRQGGGMTELEAGRAQTLAPVRSGAALHRYRDVLIALIAFAVLASLPLFTGSKALLDFVIRCSAYGLFATSLNLLVGYTGLTSFGHGMFFGLGAYSFGLIMQKLGLPIPVAFVATLAITALIAAVIGAICVRLKEIYFAFVTLAFQMLIHSTILSWASFTGGDQGLRGGIPRPAFLGIDLSNHVHLYVTSCALLVLGLLAMRQIAQSPFGYTLRMIRDNAARASFLGIDVWRAKLTVFVLAALFAAMGGMVMALFVSGAYPEFAYWTISGEAIFINMLGGVSTFLGPMVGTVLLLLLNDTVTRYTEYHGIVLGVVILFFALGLRKGLLDFVAEWFAHRRDAGEGR
ncbi:ABC-type branched-subunit amino acid transport system permease subunit [Bradyrhizobium diazoefficiens]|uniref:ABC transporter permease n=1 Tax=Bradyrhizobium diazoefficiens TaxID=1355477 RepID=UPI00359B40E5